MSVEATIEAAPRAVESTAKGLVGLIKEHPGGSLVVFGVLILLTLRYRNSIASAFAALPIIGTRAATFAANTPTSTTSTGA